MNKNPFVLRKPAAQRRTVSKGERISYGITQGPAEAGSILLDIEVLQSTRTAAASIVDRIFSMPRFVIVLSEPILVPGFKTGAFALVMPLASIDVTAGFTVAILTARRDIGLGDRIG